HLLMRLQEEHRWQLQCLVKARAAPRSRTTRCSSESVSLVIRQLGSWRGWQGRLRVAGASLVCGNPQKPGKPSAATCLNLHSSRRGGRCLCFRSGRCTARGSWHRTNAEVMLSQGAYPHPLTLGWGKCPTDAHLSMAGGQTPRLPVGSARLQHGAARIRVAV